MMKSEITEKPLEMLSKNTYTLSKLLKFIKIAMVLI